MAIFDQIAEMESLAAEAERRTPTVSAWSVGQQIQHCCLTMRSVAVAIARSRSKSIEPHLTRIGRTVFETGKIPRGRGQAPKPVRVDAQPSAADLARSLELSRAAVERLDADSKSGSFEHSYFGQLNEELAVRFIEIHNAHHLEIIRDIVAEG